jgi:hypothetical protein
MFDTPILILGFNRPELLSGLLEIVREIQPRHLFIAIDGPRAGCDSDSLLVLESRSVAGAIDWECNVRTLFRESNLGCGHAVVSAIDWAFLEVEQLIILEDDVRPSIDFFHFCAQALKLYSDNKDVFTIGGYNRTPVVERGTDLLSAYAELWGWATWRSKWGFYNIEIDKISISNLARIVRANQFNLISSLLWLIQFKSLRFRRKDIWDTQVVYWGFVHKKYHLISPGNQISNVGFGSSATHTIYEPKDIPEVTSGISKVSGVGIHDKARDRITRKQDSSQILFSAKKFLEAKIKKN